MKRLATSILAALALAACAPGPTPVPGTPIAGVNVVCDSSTAWPLAPTCSAAIAAALTALGHADLAIDYAEYHYGDNCPPGAPCASAPPNVGYLLIHLKSRGDVQVALSADPSGKVTVDGFGPVPSATT